jgi:hypothetical protein
MAVSETGAGRPLATKEQYWTFGQMYANALDGNLTDVRMTGSGSSSSYYPSLEIISDN